MSEVDDVQPMGIDPIATAFLGRFDPLEVPIILDVLRERGIFAMTKTSLDESSGDPYPFLDSGRGSVLVDRRRIDEARRLLAEEVPRRMAEMQQELGPDAEVAIPESMAPLGWLVPEVALELLSQLADAGIEAVAEYPLDAPPPPYARADGRVRIHVEEILLEEATEILENDVREALSSRGVEISEPLLGGDE